MIDHLMTIMKIQNKHMIQIFWAFLIICRIIVFSFLNIFTLIFTCSDFYCYYKKCNKCSFDKKIDCFFDKTNNLIDWILLNLFCFIIYFVLLLTFIVIKIFYKKISHCYFNYKNNKINNYQQIIRTANINDIFEPRITEICIDVDFCEELQIEETDPLLNV